MNQAFKIINTVSLMNQTLTEKKWGQAPFRGKFMRERKNVVTRNKITSVIARSKATKQSHKRAEKKWGQAPFRMFLFCIGNIYV